MLLTISTTHRPATDLGWLLHKHPERAQSFSLPFGEARVFYPEAGEERCTVALMLDVDPVGFDLMDRKLLEAILHKFDGGPVGVDNLAAAIGEERDTIEDVLEPYLIQQGYLQRTPRGRVATLLTYRHFGLAAPDAGPVRELWDANADS